MFCIFFYLLYSNCLHNFATNHIHFFIIQVFTPAVFNIQSVLSSHSLFLLAFLEQIAHNHGTLFCEKQKFNFENTENVL